MEGGFGNFRVDQESDSTLTDTRSEYMIYRKRLNDLNKRHFPRSCNWVSCITVLKL